MYQWNLRTAVRSGAKVHRQAVTHNGFAVSLLSGAAYRRVGLLLSSPLLIASRGKPCKAAGAYSDKPDANRSAYFIRRNAILMRNKISDWYGGKVLILKNDKWDNQLFSSAEWLL
ncbi:hypothetical protein [[Erwinia] mediterraneensis]|uniref:hypothetical protein n=1 Tax=[Erwinia] mediterraneensis TaxID=2161819 RepID=UPI0010324BDA|nr:hypothetical protein [[Erwinia] mediterraneensis]